MVQTSASARSSMTEAASLNDSQVTDVGVIIDVSSRKGKEVITAMEIAVQNLYNSSINYKLNLHIRDHGKHPLQAAIAAEELIEKNDVKLIIGMETWEEAGLVADIGSRAHTYDAAIGDVTILYNRTNYVEFTQPYAESGLSMIVPVKSEDSTWMFMKPFTTEMWVATAATFIYTMFIVWFLEHQSNPKFKGPWKDQISTVLWFTFSSLFYAHREKVYSNFSRTVVVLWLFVVFVLNSSYTASLSSLLTVQRLQPNVTDINFLKHNNLNVGCDNDSFVKNYLTDVLRFPPNNVISFENNESTYLKEFETNHIAALFLERPYETVFLNKYCKKYTTTTTYRFGGFGFAFQKGSPIGLDVSRAILNLSESGELKELEEKCFRPSPECSTDETSPESLTLHSFWGLYLVYGSTSAICFLLFLFRLVKHFHDHEETYQDNTNQSNKGWKKVIRLARYLHERRKRNISLGRASPSARAQDIADEWGSSRPVYVSPSDLQENHHVISLQDEIEMGHSLTSNNK
ncbi:hypothetical protein Q3G72_000126 [Acer saccharum]|nr:hypothetical protein Q3G72_000126 [Acer saccharum]